MDEELEQFCNNCKKNVGAANFASHSAFCQRNITICEVCDEPIPKNSVKEHEEEYHISVICDMCETSIKKWRLAKHQEEICPKRPVICEFCEADFPFDKAQEHNEFCGSRTEKCPICSRYIMFKHKKKHLEVHMHEENFRSGKGAGEIHQNTMNEIIRKTSEKGLKSNKMSVSSKKTDSVVTDDFEFSSMVAASASVSEKPKSKKISDEYTKCHLCRDYILWSEYDQHMTNCAPENDFKKCPYCDEYVPPFAVKDHDCKTCRMKKNSKTQINKSESAATYRSPSKFEKSESKAECRSLSNYGKSESKTEYRSVSYDFRGDHTENDLKLCPYCKQLWPQDTIYKHIKSCPEDYYECDLCLEKVLVKDRDTHFNTQCKMVLKERISSDFYECPLCGETLPEADKASHESFSCRTLLHNNEGPLYSLPVEKTSRKYVPETYENPTETCMNCQKKIPLYEVFNHKQSCNKTMTKQCAYCDKELHRDEPEEKHLRICEVYNQIVNLHDDDDDERGYGHKGAKPKHPKISEFAIPKGGKCTYCKTTLNKDILLYHEKECLYKQIRCPDCYSTMLLKDSDKHHCKSPKRKDKGIGVRRTQKAEKSDSKSSWLSWLAGNKSSVKPTLDEHQNDRNEFYENHYMTRYPKRDEDLYFAQQQSMMDDEPNIPCEFCDKLFPASEVVLHSTGCNPTEASLPKPVSAERQKGNEISSRPIKRYYDSTITSEPFFPAGRGTPIPSTKYESIHKRLEQSMPGQYLNSGETSNPQMLHSDFQSLSRKNQSSSALMSVWNNDSDVEMKEADTEPSSETTTQNLQENLKGQSRKFSHESGKCSNDSDEEISSMMNFIEGNTTESANLKEENDSHTLDKRDMNSETPADEDSFPSKSYTEISSNEHDNLRRYVSNTTNISSFEAIPKEYVPNIKSDHHRTSDYSIKGEKKQDSLSEETSKAYSSRFVSESNTDRNHQESWKNAHYISYADENSVPDKITKESTVNQNFVHNKMKDYDNDEFDRFSKTDKYQYKKNIYRTDSDSSQPETLDDEKKKQPVHDITETEFILDESKKCDLSNFRFCGNKMKTSINELGKHQNSKNEEYDVYYKTNALGCVIASEEEESKIRRPRKKDTDGSQNNILRLKYEYQDDNTAETTQDKRDENRTENVSSYMPEKSIEVIRSKYEYQDDNVIEKSQEERTKSRTQYVASSMSEKSAEMLRQKYQHDYVDDILASQKREFESKAQNVSPPMSETSKEVLGQKYRHEYIDDIMASQKREFESKAQNFSPPISETSKEIIQSKYIYQDDNAIETCQKEVEKLKLQDVSSSISERQFEMSRSKYKYQDEEENDVGQHERFKNKTRDVSSAKMEIAKEVSRSKYQHRDDDDEEDVGQHETFKSKSRDVSSAKPEMLKEMSRSKYMYQDHEEEDAGQHERFKSNTRNISSAKMEISKEVSKSKYKYRDDDEEDVSQHETFKSKTRDVSSAKPEISKEMSRSKYKYQDDEEEDIGQYERFKNKTWDVSSVKPEISKEMSRSKYKYQDAEEEDIGQYERFKNKTRDVSSVKPEISKETSRSKYMPQNVTDASFSELCERVKSRAQAASETYENLKSKYLYQDDDSQTRQKGKAGSGIEDVSSSGLEKSKEPSKYYTVCPMCRETIKWIDYNTHIPACASSSGRCARCGMKVPSSDLKEHILVKCSKIRGKVESAKERNQQILRTSAHSYEQIVQSLTSNENVGEKKSLSETRDHKEHQNARMKTSASGDKIDRTESNKNSDARRTKQAFKIEPAENYRNHPEANNRKVVDISENSRESHLKGTGQSSKSFPSNDEDLEKWYKWRNKTSDV